MNNMHAHSADLSSEEKRRLLASLLDKNARVGSTGKENLSLSSGQKALWFLHQSAPYSSAYHIAFALRIRSNFRVDALQSAFQALVDRHPMLRSKYAVENGEPIQRVYEQEEVCIERIDASGLTETDLKSKVTESYERPFDLESDRLIRMTLLSREQDDHILLLTVHHIAFDGWSLWLYQDELKKLYCAELAGIPAKLPEVSVSYSDFILWQQGFLAGEDGEKQWEYWRNQLADVEPVLNLPLDKLRPATQSYAGASIPFELESTLAKRLTTVAQAQGVTPFTLYLSAFQVLLSRYTRQQEILVASPTTGRTESQFSQVVGYFVNTVVLRGDLSNNPTFSEFLQRTRDTVLEALEHQDFPFSVLVERLQPQRDPSYSPLVQTSFVLQKPQQSSANHLVQGKNSTPQTWGDMEVTVYNINQQEGQFDLELEMLDRGDGLKSVIKYNTDLFHKETIERMTGHFSSLLVGIASNPQQRITDIPLLTLDETEELLIRWNNTDYHYSDNACLQTLVERQAKKTPDNTAVVSEDNTLSYRDLNSDANQLAHYLKNKGIGPDVVVGIFAQRSIEMVVGLLAILKAGGAYLPLDPELPDDRIAFMLQDAKVNVVLTQEDLAGDLAVYNIDIVCLNADWIEISKCNSENPSIETTLDDLAYVLYTSGSTGQPKGAMNTHRGISNRLLWMQQVYRLMETDRVLQKTPYSFDVSVWEFFWPLLTGAQLVMARPGGHKDCRYLIETVIDQGITTIHFVPPMLQLFVEENDVENCRCLKRVICSGEALPIELQTRFFSKLSAELHNLYGPTEAAIDVTFWECDSHTSLDFIPIGRPIANTQIYLLDDGLNPVPIGIPGELHIGGEGLARGYLNRDELTAEKFITNPFDNSGQSRLYKTGDLARFMSDGNIEFLGRIDNQVKIRGFRIELGEIETLLSQFSGIQETVVLARDSGRAEKCLVAYVVCERDQTPTPSILREYLGKSVPDYMIPSAFVFLEAMPLTHNGKINRRELPEPDNARGRTEQIYVPPRDELEQKLTELWEKVLNKRPLGVMDNFFEFGGHSLLAVRLTADIEKEFNKTVPLSLFFQYPTIASFSRWLRENKIALPWSPLVPIQSSGNLPPLFCVPGGGGNVLYFYELARCLGPNQPFYGLQARGLDGIDEPFSTVEAMAAHHIEAIRSVQAYGPYSLGGHCFGSMVAFEIAQQLQRQGQEVSLVVILDAPAPIDANAHPSIEWDDIDWICHFGNVIEQATEQQFELVRQVLQDLSPDQRLGRLKDCLQRAGFLPEHVDDRHVKGLLEVFKTNGRIQYSPVDIFPTPLVLLRASEFHADYNFDGREEGTIPVSALGWNTLTSASVEIRNVPGNHITMMSSSNAEALANVLSDCLENSRREKSVDSNLSQPLVSPMPLSAGSTHVKLTNVR
ncbi:MAG: amino acid adenylation domain-containing protein [Methylococcales bacterium]